MIEAAFCVCCLTGLVFGNPSMAASTGQSGRPAGLSRDQQGASLFKFLRRTYAWPKALWVLGSSCLAPRLTAPPFPNPWSPQRTVSS